MQRTQKHALFPSVDGEAVDHKTPEVNFVVLQISFPIRGQCRFDCMSEIGLGIALVNRVHD